MHIPWRQPVLILATATAVVLLPHCLSHDAQHKALKVAPDACDLLSAELPPGTCDKAKDAADLLDAILSAKRAGRARTAASAPPAASSR